LRGNCKKVSSFSQKAPSYRDGKSEASGEREDGIMGTETRRFLRSGQDYSAVGRGLRRRARSCARPLFVSLVYVIATSALARADGIETISAGLDHTCFATTSGAVQCWGLANDGRLGVKPSDASIASGSSDPRNTASVVDALPASVALVSLGGEMSCAETTDLVTKCWGRNDSGQLGTGSSEPYSFVPTPVKDLVGAKALSVGAHSACAVTPGGVVQCWGRNDHGQLGNGTLTNSNVPVPVSGIASGATDVSVGEDHACAVVSGGVRCWGRNHQGQLGNDSLSDSDHPVEVSGVSDAAKVYVGPAVSYAIKSDGSVSMWGWGKSSVSAFSAIGSGITAIAIGDLHACALSQSGAVRCWGSNAKGQLGDGTTIDRPTPVDVVGLTSGVTGIAAGRDHSCALKKAGQVVCWGAGARGQRGDGTAPPVDVVTTPQSGGVLGATTTSGTTGFTTQSVTTSATPTSTASGSITATANASSATPIGSPVASAAATSGVQLALDFNAGAAGSSIQPVGRTTDGVYMVATNQAGETHLLRASSNGGITPIKRLSPNPEAGSTTDTTGLFFTVPTGFAGAGDTWYTDGTSGGTLRVPCSSFAFSEGPKIYYGYGPGSYGAPGTSKKLGYFDLSSGEGDALFVTSEYLSVERVVDKIPVYTASDTIAWYDTETDQWKSTARLEPWPVDYWVAGREQYPEDGTYFIVVQTATKSTVYRLSRGAAGLDVVPVGSLSGTGKIVEDSGLFYVAPNCGSRTCSSSEIAAAQSAGFRFRVPKVRKPSTILKEYSKAGAPVPNAAIDWSSSKWVYAQNSQLLFSTYDTGIITPHQRLTWNSQEIVPTALRIVGNSLFIFGSTPEEGSEVWVTPFDECPSDTNKVLEGVCGCGVADVDKDGDGTMDCQDLCVTDRAKVQPGVCGCGFVDEDPDGDGVMSCKDECPNDSQKSVKGMCGCGVPDTDSDNDGKADCVDKCAADPNKSAPGACGCGVADTDSDRDGANDCFDQCPQDPRKVFPGFCGCGAVDNDTDGDHIMDCLDQCIWDPKKQEPGVCGCGKSDADSDGDAVVDCKDDCPQDAHKTSPGITGCGNSDKDTDGDGTPDVNDSCPSDKAKLVAGVCGCGVSDQDSDNDGTADCVDQCAQDGKKTLPGICGCGSADSDSDGDGAADCVDQCPSNAALTSRRNGTCEPTLGAVPPTPKPIPAVSDLSMGSVSSAAATLKRGQAWSFAGRAVNIGTARSNAETVTWYLARAKVLNPRSDVRLGSATVSAMNPGASQNAAIKVSSKVTSKIPTGKFWIIGVVSDSPGTSESARANNVAVGARQVSVKK
jgi:alpha-tubulin suppressor-like RCC1 family protein